MKKGILKNDKYKHSRGGYSRLLDISCQKCSTHICNYQKDGPGTLRRMYLDRISLPSVSTLKKELTCSNNHLIGIKMIYEKEDRPAFRLFVDSVSKKIIKS